MSYDDIDFDLPEEEPRFAYEEAEAHLDQYAAQQDCEFQRAWVKTKGMATLYAYADYFGEGVHPAVALSRGWEEMQVAFTGRGEAFLSGAVLHLWNSCEDEKAEKAFKRAVKKAFKLAEDATSREAVRLYTSKYRSAPIRNPDDGFTLEPVLPTQGVRLREWAIGEDLDADDVEEQLSWIEYADRMSTEGFHLGSDSDRPQGRPQLSLLDGGLANLFSHNNNNPDYKN